MADGGWRMADGRWRMADGDGGWRMADGGWRRWAGVAISEAAFPRSRHQRNRQTRNASLTRRRPRSASLLHVFCLGLGAQEVFQAEEGLEDVVPEGGTKGEEKGHQGPAEDDLHFLHRRRSVPEGVDVEELEAEGGIGRRGFVELVVQAARELVEERLVVLGSRLRDLVQVAALDRGRFVEHAGLRDFVRRHSLVKARQGGVVR